MDADQEEAKSAAFRIEMMRLVKDHYGDPLANARAMEAVSSAVASFMAALTAGTCRNCKRKVYTVFMMDLGISFATDTMEAPPVHGQEMGKA